MSSSLLSSASASSSSRSIASTAPSTPHWRSPKMHSSGPSKSASTSPRHLTAATFQPPTSLDTLEFEPQQLPRRSRRISADIDARSAAARDAQAHRRSAVSSGRSTPGEYEHPPQLHSGEHEAPRRSQASTRRSNGVRPLSMSAAPNSAAPYAITEQWWEHVLPPGQLAERLRRAQAAAAVPASASANDVSAIREYGHGTAAPSTADRASRLAAGSLGRSSPAQSTSNASKLARPASHQGTLSSTAAPRRSALRATPSNRQCELERSHSENSQSSDGSAGADAEKRHSPEFNGGHWSGDGKTSPGGTVRAPHAAGHYPASSFSRSTSVRRSRVMSEDGIGLGFGVSHSNGSIGSWEHAAPGFKPFPTSTGGRVSPAFYYSSTPDFSSEDDQPPASSRSRPPRVSTTTRTTRITRTTSTTSITSMSGAEAASHDASHREQRRVSFSHDAKPDTSASGSRRGSVQGSTPGVRKGPSGTATPVAGNAHLPFPSSASTSQRASRNEAAFDQLPTLRTWQPAHDTSASRDMFPGRGGFSRRVPSHSAPTSPRQSIHLQDHERPRFEGFGVRHRNGFAAGESIDETQHLPDLALLNSLNHAHTQLAGAGNLAMALTRQLSAPLRPVMHVALFLSISSITLVTLVGCLIASYVLSVWDDVGLRGRRVGAAAGQARRNIEGGLTWGRRMLGAPGGKEPSAGQRQRISLLAPIYYTIAVPGVLAQKLAPSALAERLGVEVADMPAPRSRRGSSAVGSDTSSRRDSGSTEAGEPAADGSPKLGPSSRPGSPSSHPMPPRPPLSHLLPSIFFTLVIALFAGLASYLTTRRGGSPRDGVSTPPVAPMSSRRPRAPVSASAGSRRPYSVHDESPPRCC
jgi:hypothetical protein